MNTSFGNIKAIARRELAGYFSSPVAYVFIVIFLLLTGFFTFMIGDFFERGQANLDSFFMWHPWLYLFLVPCVGMRLWAEERRVGTIELLLTKPVTVWQAVVGKFLASWIFLGLSLALTFPVVITINYLGAPDNGVVIGAYLGSLLMAGAYLAISCMTSAMTRNQVISFILSVVICLFLVLCGYPPVTSLLTRMDKPWVVDLVSSLSVMTHFQPFSTGLVDTQDVLFFLLIIAFALFANGVIILNHQASSDRLMRRKTFERIIYSAGGVAAMFVVMLSAYIVAGAFKARIDITADREHTLSTGTKRILDSLDSRVTIRFYCTESGNSMPPQLKAYAQRVEDMLHEYERESKGHIKVEQLDPQPDSEAEDSARVDGVDGRPTGPFGSDKIYMGIAVSLLDQKFVLPWLSPDRERLLEYDLSRAIDRVTSPSRPVLGVMTVLPVWGGAQDPLMRPGQGGAQEWAFITELKKDFTVRAVPMTATNIDSDINVLLVADPVDISDMAQYAIDQFVLRGGKLLAFLDPHAYFDQTHGSQNFFVEGDNAARSSLPDLLKAWGLDMNIDKVVADTSFASRNMQTGDSMPTLLMVTQDGINQTDVITAEIDNLVFPFAGAFTGKAADGLAETVLVNSTPDSDLVDTLIAAGNSQQILENFKPSHTEYPLAVRLAGKFRTAFPDGRPSENGGNVPDPAQLKTASRDSEVVLVSDSDLLNDHVSVKVQNIMGHRLVSPMNGNLNFVQSLVEELAGDDNLISSRSRANMGHPFTRVKTMEANAGKQLQAKVRELETQQRNMDQKIKELQAAGEGNQSTILSPDQQQELAQYQQSMARINKELEQVRGKLRKDTEALEFKTKLINIGAMPLLVALSGLALAVVRTRRRMPRKLPARPMRISERPAAVSQEIGASK
ncbi:MAG TPA: Gldg family protein [Candidatus Sulfotelmatobacter sp.]|nr:Gldg family protein [Candidatus Sulfotelmatobacter sp.]